MGRQTQWLFEVPMAFQGDSDVNSYKPSEFWFARLTDLLQSS